MRLPVPSSLSDLSRRWSQRLALRIKTQWRPLQVSLRPASLQTIPGQWLPAFDEALSTWSDWCAEHAGACAHVQLSAHWLLVAVAEGALVSWQHYYGLSAEDLQREWVLRSVKVGQSPSTAESPCELHCAVPKALIDGLKDTAKQHGVQVQWVGPWWIQNLEQHVTEQMQLGNSVQPWSAAEPGLRVHASLSWDEQAKPSVQLRQVWCEAEAA